MKIKLTQEQHEFIETFGKDKNLAFCFIGRWGFGYNLKDGNEKVYGTNVKPPFTCDEKEKMLNALINGYEVIEPEFKFFNYFTKGHYPLYYAGDFNQLTDNEEEALKVKKDSEEYKALKLLGFLKEEVWNRKVSCLLTIHFFYDIIYIYENWKRC